ncbi:hypothetical protein D3C85_1331290 [compost metagenome]
MRIVNRAFRVCHNDPQGITQPLQLALVGEVIDNKGVRTGDAFLKACVQFELARLPAQQDREQRAHTDDQPTIIK